MDNPVRFIDPDGMAVEDKVDRTTYTEDDAKNKFAQLQAQSSSKKSSEAAKEESGFSSSSSSLSFNSKTQARRESMAQTGGPGDPKKKEHKRENSSSEGDGRGSATSFSFGFALGFGISGEWGVVSDETGDSKGYYTVSANFGLGLDFGFNKKEIIPTNKNRFRVNQYQGQGKNLSIGAFFTGEARGGNTNSNFNGFGVDYKERSNSLSPMLGIPVNFGPGDVGIIYQLSNTSFFK